MASVRTIPLSMCNNRCHLVWNGMLHVVCVYAKIVDATVHVMKKNNKRKHWRSGYTFLEQQILDG